MCTLLAPCHVLSHLWALNKLFPATVSLAHSSFPDWVGRTQLSKVFSDSPWEADPSDLWASGIPHLPPSCTVQWRSPLLAPQMPETVAQLFRPDTSSCTGFSAPLPPFLSFTTLSLTPFVLALSESCLSVQREPLLHNILLTQNNTLKHGWKKYEEN